MSCCRRGSAWEGSGDPHHGPVVLARPPAQGEASPRVRGTALHPQRRPFGEQPPTPSKIHRTQGKQGLQPREKYIKPQFLSIRLQVKARVCQADEVGRSS